MKKIRTLRLDRGMTQEEVAVVPKSVADYNDTPSNGEEFFFELISTLAPRMKHSGTKSWNTQNSSQRLRASNETHRIRPLMTVLRTDMYWRGRKIYNLVL